MHSNLLIGTILFLGFLLTWGCSKNVAPPDVEEPPAPVVEMIPDAGPEEDFTPEEADRIEESDEGFAGGGFETSGPEAVDPIDEIDVVEVAPSSNDPVTTDPAPETDFTQEQGFGIENATRSCRSGRGDSHANAGRCFCGTWC